MLCFRVLGAFLEHLAPQARSPVVIAACAGQEGQVAPGQMAVDPRVLAAKLLRALQAEDPRERCLGLRPLSAPQVYDSASAPQFRILGVDPQSLRARLQRRGALSHLC
jgi:hypothetical protein